LKLKSARMKRRRKLRVRKRPRGTLRSPKALKNPPRQKRLLNLQTQAAVATTTIRNRRKPPSRKTCDFVLLVH